MSGPFEHTLAACMVPLIVEDFPRFNEAVQKLSSSLQEHFKTFDTPREEENLLIGHFGLLGEANNSLGFVFHTKLAHLPACNDNSRLTTEWAHWLHKRVHGESQYGRTVQNGETVLDAFRRIERGIASWTERNRDRLPAEESRKIDGLRAEFRASFDRLEQSIEEIGEHFASCQPAFQPMPLKDLLKLHL